jgi:hypothetical protein
MFLFNISSRKKEAVEKISYLIQQLKTKKKEWKKFRPKYVSLKDRRISDVAFFGGERHPVIEYYVNKIIDCHYELEHLMKRLRKDIIKLCSRYISLLKRAMGLIGKEENSKTKNRLKQISEIMAKLYNDFILSAWRKRVGEIHKFEFKAALEIKKFRRELGRRAMNEDIGWLKKHAPEIEEILSYAKGQDSQTFKESIMKTLVHPGKSEYWKNWRKYSLVKVELRRMVDFLKFMKEIDYQYIRVIKNL